MNIVFENTVLEKIIDAAADADCRDRKIAYIELSVEETAALERELQRVPLYRRDEVRGRQFHWLVWGVRKGFFFHRYLALRGPLRGYWLDKGSDCFADCWTPSEALAGFVLGHFRDRPASRQP